MGLVDLPEDNRSKPNVDDINNAHKLLELLRGFNRVTAPTSVNEWAIIFKRMRRGEKHPQEEISLILDWLKVNADAPYVPQVYSAESFRKKYPMLLDAVRRDRGGIRTEVCPEEIVGDLQETMNWVNNLRWPSTSIPHLVNCVTSSLINYTDFLKKYATWRVWVKGSATSDHYICFAAEEMAHAFDSPARAMSDHWEDVHRRVITWPDFDGRLAPFVWTTNDRQWMADMRRRLLPLVGTAYHWDGIMKKVMGKDAS